MKTLTQQHRSSIAKGMIRYWDKAGRTGTINSSGYRLVAVGGKQKYEHRVVMEKYLGRKLHTSEVVHHIDGNKQNNNIENLTVTNNPEHSKLHSQKYLGKDRLGVEPVNKTPKDVIAKIKRLRRMGLLLDDICEIVGISYPTVQKYAKGVI